MYRNIKTSSSKKIKFTTLIPIKNYRQAERQENMTCNEKKAQSIQIELAMTQMIELINKLKSKLNPK